MLDLFMIFSNKKTRHSLVFLHIISLLHCFIHSYELHMKEYPAPKGSF